MFPAIFMSLNIGRVLGGVLALSFEAPQIYGTGALSRGRGNC